MVNNEVPRTTEAAVLVLDFLQEALHARHQIDGVERCGVAGRLEIARQWLLHRRRDNDLGRRRRDITILFAATHEQCERDKSRTAEATALAHARGDATGNPQRDRLGRDCFDRTCQASIVGH
jgi:hypothetical protein